MKVLSNLDLTKNQLLNSVIQRVSEDPTTKLQAGWLIFNTTESKLKYYNGDAWVTIGSGSGGSGSSIDIDSVITKNSTNLNAAGSKAVYTFVTDQLKDIRAVSGGYVLIVDPSTNKVIGIGVDDTVTENSENLIKSSAVYTAIDNMKSTIDTKATVYRKTNPTLNADSDNNCEWVISDISFTQLPSITLYESDTGEVIFTNVKVNVSQNKIIISFKLTGDISANKYTAVVVI